MWNLEMVKSAEEEKHSQNIQQDRASDESTRHRSKGGFAPKP